MARIRTIKPDFFTSEDIVSRSPLARLLYIATWLEADREGRLVWKPKTLKLRYLPGDNCDIEAVAKELIDAGLIIPYDVDGQQFAEIPSFTRHQVINNRETASEIPARIADASPTRPPRDNDASPTRDDATGTPLVGKEGKGKEGKGSKPTSDEVGSDQPAAAHLPACPHQEIIKLYGKHLPTLPQPRAWEGQRANNLRARWRWVLTAKNRKDDRYATDAASAVAFFDRFFGYVAASEFLTGRDGKWPGCDLAWLVKAENFAKVIEGKYENRGQA